EQSEEVVCREQKWRCSKPPVTKVKLGLDLEQHELSAILEVDTPKSCNVSYADKTDSIDGESPPVSTTGKFASVKCYSHVCDGGGRFPLSITDYEKPTSKGSPRQSKQSCSLLQEVLMRAAENSYDS
ncbi:CE295 protein, partial [Thinocorus orbignyianus]|nr:CE295 protein [Thinocorus orbignyianus]